MLDTVKAYLPPGMTPQQEAELKLELERLAFEKQKQADAMLADAERHVTERISLLEGTATDLRSVPFIGPIMLFMRGVLRGRCGGSQLCGLTACGSLGNGGS